MKKILYPVDLENRHGISSAIAHLQALAKGYEIEIDMLTVSTINQELKSLVAYDDSKTMAATKEELQEVVQQFDVAGLVINFVVINGNPVDEILTYSKKHQTDMILISSHKPGLKEHFLGSGAGHIARDAKCSVLVLRD